MSFASGASDKHRSARPDVSDATLRFWLRSFWTSVVCGGTDRHVFSTNGIQTTRFEFLTITPVFSLELRFRAPRGKPLLSNFSDPPHFSPVPFSATPLWKSVCVSNWAIFRLADTSTAPLTRGTSRNWRGTSDACSRRSHIRSCTAHASCGNGTKADSYRCFRGRVDACFSDGSVGLSRRETNWPGVCPVWRLN